MWIVVIASKCAFFGGNRCVAVIYRKIVRCKNTLLQPRFFFHPKKTPTESSEIKSQFGVNHLLSKTIENQLFWQPWNAVLVKYISRTHISSPCLSIFGVNKNQVYTSCLHSLNSIFLFSVESFYHFHPKVNLRTLQKENLISPIVTFPSWSQQIAFHTENSHCL